ncbi:hypothetical protein R0137_17220 [Congregibacter brevis]|uniref:Uncharacterized protein n=1 Tax=Congregibacter brevis TaxID=3081201 RepID=A0ABZ0IF66_9GAMM|nr:hypothetical protein R0137_17220 [Congregibacter sp. IMCC45268]
MKNQTTWPQPKRQKLAFLTFLGLLLPVYVIPPVLQNVLPNRRLLSVVASAGLMVWLMSYFIMLFLMHVAGDWLDL